MMEHFCDNRSDIDIDNNCAWIVFKEDQKIWVAKCIDSNEFIYDLQILHCPYCGNKLKKP